SGRFFGRHRASPVLKSRGTIVADLETQQTVEGKLRRKLGGAPTVAHHTALWYFLSPMKKARLLLFVSRARLVTVLLWAVGAAHAQSSVDVGWPNYGNDPGGSRYSALRQIDRSNVTQLRVAWTYRTGALGHQEELDRKAAFEATPILIAGKLFLSTPYDHVIALNPHTGAKLWEFDPQLELPYGGSEVTSRGVSAWQDSSAKARQPCALRIFIGTIDAHLI